MGEKGFKSEVWSIDKLKKWDKNPRTINSVDFERLKKQIQKLGSYKPLLITPEGIVIGGNMRLEALKELGQTDIWVSIVEPKNEAEMLEYALSDNDRAGNYNELELSELLNANEIQRELYRVDLGLAKSLDELPSMFDPASQDEQGKLDEKQKVTCPECGHEFEA